ncbi:MAG: hypothetical protein L0154_10660 [Chloroflexi bacterium]|nr:hypothetical protein [Chloroflexota bacterium]
MQSLTRLIAMLYLVFGIIAGSFSTPTSYAGEDPQFYYFDKAKGAFVIESATGDSSRILFDLSEVGIEDTNHDFTIIGPGWSPSGEWLVWLAGSWQSLTSGAAGLGSSRNLFVYSRSSEKNAPIFKKPEEVALLLSIDWSPVEDLLLVHYINKEQNAVVVVLDALSLELTLKMEIDGSDEGSGIGGWTPAGNLEMYEFQDGGYSYLYRVLNTTGESLDTREIDATASCFAENIFWSNSGYFAYLKPRTQTLNIGSISPAIHVETGLRFNNYHVIWSPDGNFALIFDRCESYELSSVNLFSVETSEIETIMDEARTPPSWDFNPWSPTGNRAVLFNPIVNPYILDAETLNLEPIDYTANKSDPLIEWALDGDTLAYYSLAENRKIYIVNLATNVQSSIWSIDVQNRPVDIAFSSTGKYLAYTEYEEGSDLHVWDILAQEKLSAVELLRGAFGQVNFPAGEIWWHADSEWLLFAGDTGWVDTVVNIVNANGQFHREVGQCVLSPSCFGWMPEEK